MVRYAMIFIRFFINNQQEISLCLTQLIGHLTLNPSPEEEGLKNQLISFLLLFFRQLAERKVPIAIGRGMRQ
jgi:hypothetical protein